ncbi:MAG: PEP/pyruvate-binding domain-containing protein [Thermodesulfobacteriota bacterium]|nr:PEP/pyruvate-binding domain-containing protein [Thermodesulfobacteriota bacterium]
MFNFFSKKRREKALRGEDERDLFARKYKALQELLNANNAALATMGDMQEKASGAYAFDMAYVKASYQSVAGSIRQIVDNLNLLSDDRYKDLDTAYERIDRAVQQALSEMTAIPETDYVLHLDAVDETLLRACGGKMAFLGGVAGRVGLPVPHAFVITTFAYQRFVRHNQIESILMDRCNKVDIRDYAALEEASREMQSLVQKATIPDDLGQAILAAFEDMKTKTADGGLRVSVRSSAVHEDIMASFAGQYKTILNVTEENLLGKYRDVLSSQFTPRALFYYKDKGFNVEEMAMAVGVVQMIEALSSGIVYSRDVGNPEADTVLINAVWGLGDYAVGGMVPPETFKVVAQEGKGHEDWEIVRDKTDRQEVMMRPIASGGTEEVPVPDHLEENSSLSDDQALKLAGFSRELEAHFGTYQDSEWAVDEKGEMYILQSRPLRLSHSSRAAQPEPRHVAGHELLINEGKIASRGVAAGPVCQVQDSRTMGAFPRGGVLVVRQAHPEFAVLLEKACAVIADTGAVLGHLATVAREGGVPAIFNTKDATKVLRDGVAVTVDGVYGRVYEGEVLELLDLGEERPGFENSPICQRLRTILKEITPLHMTDPRASDFKAGRCQTFHDITRFSHEKALKEMFQFSENTYISEKSARKLTSGKIPMEWLVIDLDNGVRSDVKGKRLDAKDITSLPMRALWEGMIAVPWKGPPPMDTKGFVSVIMGSSTDPDAASYLTDKNYIILSQNYCNVSTRLGFHFSTTEAYLGEEETQNYVTFMFKGGGADAGRKNRRAALISRLLEQYDFRVEVKDDAVLARVEGHEQGFLEKRLMVLGYIIVHTRQMDMVMLNDAMVNWYYKDFHKGIESFVNKSR